MILRGVAGLAAGLMLMHPARAQQTDYMSMFERSDMFEPFADVSYMYDDNVFRIPDVEKVGEPTSDTSWKREAGLSIDKTVSRQHFTANLDAYKVTFDRFNEIDYVGKDAVGNWAWGFYNDLSGDIGASYTESLTPYSQFHSEQLNLRSDRREYADENWLMTARWQLHASLTNDTLKYDLSEEQYLDRNQHVGNIGIDYVSPQGSKAGVSVQRERGEFPVEEFIGTLAVNNNYTQNEVLADFDSLYGGFTHVHVVAGWLRRYYDQFASRDVSGPTAQLNVYWTPTAKSVLSLAAWHAINASDELTVGYSINEGLSLNPIWNVTPKFQVSGMLRGERLNYANASVFGLLAPQNRVDYMHDGSVSLLYTPVRRVQLSAVLYADRLTSTVPIYEFKDKGMMLNLKGSF